MGLPSDTDTVVIEDRATEKGPGVCVCAYSGEDSIYFIVAEKGNRNGKYMTRDVDIMRHYENFR